MSKEEAINHFIEAIANLKEQNDVFAGSPSEELYQCIYDNEVRISELRRVIDYLRGDW